MSRSIDSHVHIWDRSRNEIFIAENQHPSLKGKSFLPSDLQTTLKDTLCKQAVLVHGPATIEHTKFCIDLCNKHDFIKSVIGWVDLESNHCIEQYKEFNTENNFKGIRLTPLLYSNPEAYITSNNAKDLADEIAKEGKILEILVTTKLINNLISLLEEVSNVKVVLGHFGLPESVGDDFDYWENVIKKLSSFPNVYVKVSGLSLQNNFQEDLNKAIQYFNVIENSFGFEKMLYSSNWPVCTAFSTPRYWKEILDKIFKMKKIKDSNIEKIMMKNADLLY